MIHPDNYPDPQAWEGYQRSRRQSQEQESDQQKPWTEEEREAAWAKLLKAARARPGLLVKDGWYTVDISDRANPWDGGLYNKQSQIAYEEARAWLREHGIEF